MHIRFWPNRFINMSPSYFLWHFMQTACFPGDSGGKEFACSARDPGSVPGLGRSPGEGNGHPLQYSCLEKSWSEEPGGLESMGSQRNQTWLSDFSLIWNTLFNLYINLITRATMRIYFHFWKCRTYNWNILTLLISIFRWGN